MFSFINIIISCETFWSFRSSLVKLKLYFIRHVNTIGKYVRTNAILNGDFGCYMSTTRCRFWEQKRKRGEKECAMRFSECVAKRACMTQSFHHNDCCWEPTYEIRCRKVLSMHNKKPNYRQKFFPWIYSITYLAIYLCVCLCVHKFIDLCTSMKTKRK